MTDRASPEGLRDAPTRFRDALWEVGAEVALADILRAMTKTGLAFAALRPSPDSATPAIGSASAEPDRADHEEWRRRIVEHLGPQRMSLYMSKDIDHMATGAVIAAALATPDRADLGTALAAAETLDESASDHPRRLVEVSRETFRAMLLEPLRRALATPDRADPPISGDGKEWHLTPGAMDAMNAALTKTFPIYDDPEAGTDVDGDTISIFDYLYQNGYVVRPVRAATPDRADTGPRPDSGIDGIADDVRYAGGNGTSDYWRGFNDGIDALVARLSTPRTETSDD